MTSAVDRAGDRQRVRTRARGEELNRSHSEEEEDGDAAGDGEGEGRRCGCGKTLLRRPSAPTAVSPSMKHSRRKRRKKPPYGGEQRNFSDGTADTAAAALNIAAVPEIRVIGETDPEDERESSRELSSGTNSTGGAVDEGIYDGNSSSIESSLFGNKSSKSSGSRKSSRDDTRTSRAQRWSRRPSYLHTGDAISLMIIEGCELCRESKYCNCN